MAESSRRQAGNSDDAYMGRWSGRWQSVTRAPLEVPTVFRDFEDFWQPFTLGAGSAPGYCAKLDLAERERLRRKLSDDLVSNRDGTIPLEVRAWAVKTKV